MFKHKPLSIRKALVKAMTIRMAQAYGIKRSELPNLLDCKRAVVNNWSYYGRIPHDHLLECHEKTGVSMEWLLFDQKPQFELTPEKYAALLQLTSKLFIDANDFNMITENYLGATKQLGDKFEKDLLKWLGCEPPDEAKAALTKTTKK